MSADVFISIDQNCQPLWDTIPKLAALARHGWRGTHYLEDIDVAFSRQGAQPGDTGLALLPERFYRGGHSDWGAALFAHDFLGRLPLDIRTLEPYTGRTTAALARLLEASVDDLYERWSASDNWQLVGSSYAADPRWHRLIGDVRLAEAGPYVLELLRRARADLLERFPEAAAQARVTDWFSGQEAFAAGILAATPEAPLTELYRRWLQAALGPATGLGLTSARFALERLAATDPLLRLFLEHYGEAAEAYNRAIAETATGMTPLRLQDGELPFFVTVRRDGRLLRSAAAWRDGAVEVAGERWPLVAGGLPVAEMARAGVVALAGKALLLVLQARLGPDAAVLALPHQGSLYMPAAYAFERLLRDRGLLQASPLPVVRVRCRFLQHWHGCRTVVRPPPYLAQALGLSEAPATTLAEAIAAAQATAQTTLAALRDANRRDALLRERFGAWTAAREELEARRRQLAPDPQRRAEATALWQQVKELDRRLAAAQAEWVIELLRLLDVSYYDSRGALLPWCLALEGEALYGRLLTQTEITPEEAGAPGEPQ